MANPQPQNGHTRVANEILENVVKFKFNATHLQIIMVVWRFTYGFQRKDHDLSVSFIAEATNIHYRNVKREVKALIDNKVLTVTKDSTFSNSRRMALNKDYDVWTIEKREPVKVGANKTRGGGNAPTQGADLPPQEPFRGGGNAPQERKSFKDNLKENIYVEIISYLNQKTGKRFSEKTENTIKAINGRLNEGKTLEDFKHVIDVKTAEWLHNAKMKKFLCPDTLFRPGNFEKYLNQERSSDDEGSIDQWVKELEDEKDEH